MSTIQTLPVLAGAAAQAAGMRAVRIEKCPGSGSSNGEYRDRPEPRERRASHSDRRAVSRDGTGKTAPLWHGPRLRAPFVAQIIGQVLSHDEAAPQQAAYGEGHMPVAIIVDNRA